MTQESIAMITGDQVAAALNGKETAILEVVAEAYRIHARGDTALPHSSFLRFPRLERERIIALPAYLGGDFQSAGLKWISSFPGNIQQGLERASAVLMLNRLDTGRVYAVLESSLISALRTAASAALAAQLLTQGTSVDTVGVVGCGLINFQTLRFLRVSMPELRRAVLLDIDRTRAAQFQRVCRERLGFESVTTAASWAELSTATSLVSFATTATVPHVESAERLCPGSVILHLSLRDLAPSLILAADNVVDDVDHVCRANTSLHLAEQETGHRRFIRCTLGEILLQQQPATADPVRLSLFSPFGLGILDLAVGQLAFREATASGKVTALEGFYPRPWLEG